MSGVDVVITDYGVVRLRLETLAWLLSLDENWSEIANSRKRRGKHATFVRNKVRQLESAVCVAAAIAWHAGKDLTEF